MPSEKQKTLERLTKNVVRSTEENSPNIETYNFWRRFSYKTTLTDDMKQAFAGRDIPPIELNLSVAHLNRFLGEFVEHKPGISVYLKENNDQDQTGEIIAQIYEGIIKYIFFDADCRGVQQRIITESASGGFSWAKVIAKYKEGDTFEKEIIFTNTYNPCLVGCDVLARNPGREDSSYTFEQYPYSKEEFEETFKVKIDDIEFNKYQGKFKWFYEIGDQKIVVVVDYYEKVTEYKTLVELSSGEVIDKKKYEEILEEYNIQQAIGAKDNVLSDAPIIEPKIIRERKNPEIKIRRYQFCGNEILNGNGKGEIVEELSSLPHIKFDCNSTVLEDKKSVTTVYTTPYLYHVLGLQKMINNIFSTLADECQNYNKHCISIAEESLCVAYLDKLKSSTDKILVYKAYSNNNPEMPNPPPVQMSKSVFPNELFSLFQYTPVMLQNLLGSSDGAYSSLGAGESPSGIAIQEASARSSYASKTCVDNYFLSLNQVAKVILEMIPNVYVEEMTVPIIDRQGKKQYVKINGKGHPNLKIDTNKFDIKVEANQNFASQQNRSIDTLVKLAKVTPGCAELVDRSLNVICDNINIRGQDQIKEIAESIIEEKQQARQQPQQQPDPRVMREQNRQVELEATAQLKIAQLKHEEKKTEMEATINAAKLALENIELNLKAIHEQGQLQTEQQYISMKKEEIEADQARSIVRHANEQAERLHRHKKETEEKEHKVNIDLIDRLHNNIELQSKVAGSHRATGNPHFTGEK